MCIFKVENLLSPIPFHVYGKPNTQQKDPTPTIANTPNPQSRFQHCSLIQTNHSLWDVRKK